LDRFVAEDNFSNFFKSAESKRVDIVAVAIGLQRTALYIL